jgi:hypothetical protein
MSPYRTNCNKINSYNHVHNSNNNGTSFCHHSSKLWALRQDIVVAPVKRTICLEIICQSILVSCIVPSKYDICHKYAELLHWSILLVKSHRAACIEAMLFQDRWMVRTRWTRSCAAKWRFNHMVLCMFEECCIETL